MSDAVQDVAEFYDPYVREMHACKDTGGNSLWNFEEPLYTLLVENVRMPGIAKPNSSSSLRVHTASSAAKPIAISSASCVLPAVSGCNFDFQLTKQPYTKKQ